MRRAIDNRPYGRDVAVGNGLIRSANQARCAECMNAFPTRWVGVRRAIDNRPSGRDAAVGNGFIRSGSGCGGCETAKKDSLAGRESWEDGIYLPLRTSMKRLSM